VALVTGASRGIGRACALALAQAGIDVAVHYNGNAEQAATVAGDIAKIENRRAQVFQADLSQLGASEKLVETVADKFGPPTILIHAAGQMIEKPLGFTTAADWDLLFETHAFSAAALAKAALRYMRKSEDGRIVFIGSLAGCVGLGNAAGYSAAKGALTGLCKSLALEASRWKTTVNLLAPGYIATDMTKDQTPERREETIKSIPLGRYGTPEDVAALAAFLCSREAGWITGQTFVIDGGMSVA
jgi:3-oxoacyl-[acyl-carrier protein] reductase